MTSWCDPVSARSRPRWPVGYAFGLVAEVVEMEGDDLGEAGVVFDDEYFLAYGSARSDLAFVEHGDQRRVIGVEGQQDSAAAAARLVGGEDEFGGLQGLARGRARRLR